MTWPVNLAREVEDKQSERCEDEIGDEAVFDDTDTVVSRIE